MRVTGLRIDGFGVFAGFSVQDIGARTTVVCGPNEAGKSTLHTFIVRTLFGHPRLNDARGRRRHEPLRGGRHGGVVRAADGDGGTWEIHRYTTGSPVLRVVTPDGTESASDDALTALLGHGMDGERYQQVFAVDLDALAGLGTLRGDALDELLLDAATVGAGRSMRRSITALEERRDGLWTPRSRKLPLNAEISARKAAERRLRDARDAAGAYRAVQEDLARVERELGEVRADQITNREKIRRLQRLQDAWPTFGDLVDARRRASEAGDTVVPEGLAQHATELQEERQRTTERTEDLRARAAKHAEAANAVVVDDRLVGIAQRVAGHATDLGLQSDRRRRMEQAAQHVLATADTATKALAALPRTWDAERVMTAPSDPTIPPAVQRSVGALQTAQQELDRAENAVEEARRFLEERRTQASRLADAVGDEPTADIRARRVAVGALRGAVPDLERLEAARFTSAASPRWPALVATGAAMVLIGIGATALTSGLTLLGAGAIATAVLVGVAAGGMLRASNRPGNSAASTGPAVELRRQITEAAGDLGLSPPITRADIELADQLTAQLEDDRRAWRMRRDASDAAAEEATAAASTLARAEARRGEYAKAAQTASAEWGDARDRAGLDESTEPSSAPALLSAITEARRARVEADRAALAHDEIADDVAAFDTGTAELCAAVDRDPAELPDAALRRLAEDCRADETARSERGRLIASAQQDHEAAENGAAQIEELDSALAAIYTHVGVEDEQAFAAAVAADAARRAAEDDHERAERELRRHLGDDEEAAALRAELETGRLGAWADELAELQRHAEELDADRDRLVSERTSTVRQLEELGEDDAVAAAALEVETHMARCEELAKEWATTDLAAGLLRTTLERFENAHQPSVLREAGALLAQATLGRWTDVRRIDDELYVAADGDPVPAGALSRGATEQLYLCLRLALAEELNRGAVRLPLLIDDLMANADPQRADGLSRILADVATRQQVVVFTCNPATADRVVAADPSAGVLSMNAGGVGAGWGRTPAT